MLEKEPVKTRGNHFVHHKGGSETEAQLCQRWNILMSIPVRDVLAVLASLPVQCVRAQPPAKTKSSL